MIESIAGYNAFAQPLIQERLANQRAAVQSKPPVSSGPNSDKPTREDVFRTLLNANAKPSDESSRAKTPDQNAASGFRGNVLDVKV